MGQHGTVEVRLDCGVEWSRRGGEGVGVRGGGLTKADVIVVMIGSDGSLSLLTVHVIQKPQLCPHLLCYDLSILYTDRERGK